MSRLQNWISLAFLLLALGLMAILEGYWRIALEPGLRREAQYQANLMAQAQAERLAERLAEAQRQQRPELVTGALDEILSFTERRSDTPFFARIELELDPNPNAVLLPDTGPHDRLVGGRDCQSCFQAEIAILAPSDYQLMGIGHFWINDLFFQRQQLDFRRHLLIQAAVGGALLLIAWMAVLVLTQQIQRQSARRYEAEHALLQNQARYRRLLDSLSGYFVYARSVDGRVHFVSDSVVQVLGYTPEAVCRDFQDLLIDAPGSGGFPAPPSAAETNSVRLALRDRNGHIHHLECSETRRPEATADEVIEGIARDVSAQQALEDSLREAKEQAERANRAKSAFLANVSHEIRTPMAGIIGLAKLLLKHNADPRASEHLRQILTSGQSLLAILNDILDISKMEAGKVVLEQEPFALERVLDQLVSLTAIKAETKGLEFVLAIGPGVPRELRGDPTRLGQILLNLTNNAIKFTAKGHVLVCVECLGRTAVGVMLRFVVEDTGIGIARKDLRRLFEPFTQVDEPHNRHHGGTGLGLAISRHLVEQMDSRLAVDSTPGRGSRFSFTTECAVPIADPLAPLPALAPDSPPPVCRGTSVLLADDHALTQCALAELLTESGYRVALAESVSQAQSMLVEACVRRQPFALLLLDADFAPQVLPYIRHSDAIHPVPAIVLMSGYGARAHLEPHAQVDAYLLKPSHRSAFSQAIITAFAQSAADQRAAEVAAPSPTIPIPTAAAFPPGTRVLLAEDHAANRAIAVELLEALGLEVEAVTDGYAVLECLARGHGFAAVLMDIQMPGLSGIEATRRLRADPRFAALPVIAVTAYAMIGDAERFRSAGMTDYLSKPLDEDRLLEVLRLWIPQDMSTHFIKTHQHILPELNDALAQGYAADAIAIAHRLRTAAQDINAIAIAEAAHSFQLAVARKMPTEAPLRQLEAALKES